MNNAILVLENQKMNRFTHMLLVLKKKTLQEELKRQASMQWKFRLLLEEKKSRLENWAR